eukprot:4448045-Amphidinium_carterae.1
MLSTSFNASNGGVAANTPNMLGSQDFSSLTTMQSAAEVGSLCVALVDVNPLHRDEGFSFTALSGHLVVQMELVRKRTSSNGVCFAFCGSSTAPVMLSWYST